MSECLYALCVLAIIILIIVGMNTSHFCANPENPDCPNFWKNQGRKN